MNICTYQLWPANIIFSLSVNPNKLLLNNCVSPAHMHNLNKNDRKFENTNLTAHMKVFHYVLTLFVYS